MSGWRSVVLLVMQMINVFAGCGLVAKLHSPPRRPARARLQKVDSEFFDNATLSLVQ